VEEAILKTLSGKRIALLGFAAEEAELLTWTFDQVQAFCRTLSPHTVEPDSAALGAYDLLVLHLDESITQSVWLRAERLAGLPKPLLVIGPASYLGEHMAVAQEYAADFMTTPLNPAEVVLRSYHILCKAEAAASEETPAPRPLSVVIADDDATTIALVRAVLQRDGIQCQVAHDGGQALEMISDTLPQAAIMDINMPYLDGFEVLAALRNQPRTAGVSVVLLTSRQQEADIVRGFGLGADDYIVKPFSPMELMARLRRLLRNGGHVTND
jgi:two-component system alkaline phosphatase synthesis response regulator PhoP/two-component system response regulator VicR